MLTIVRKTLALHLTIVLSSQTAVSANVFFQADGVSATTFEGVTEARSDATSFVANYIVTNPPKQLSQQLSRLIEKAQHAFLTNTDAEAIGKFQEITAISRSADWNESQRQSVIYAYFRIVQLEHDPGKRQKAMEAAIAFAADLPPDTRLFPPPITHLWKQIRNELQNKVVKINLESKFAGYEIIKLNGKTIHLSHKEEFAFYPGSYRLTLLSNHLRPITQIINSSQLQIFKVDSHALARGTCEHPEISKFEELGIEKGYFVFDDNCVREYSRQGWTPLQGRPSPSVKELSVTSFPQDVNFSANLETPKDSSLNKRWIWGGLALAVIGGIIAAQNKESKSEPVVTPAQRNGF